MLVILFFWTKTRQLLNFWDIIFLKGTVHFTNLCLHVNQVRAHFVICIHVKRHQVTLFELGFQFWVTLLVTLTLPK